MPISSSESVISVRRSSPKRSAISSQLLADDRVDARLVAEDLAQLADPLDLVVVLGLDRVGLERGELRQAQVEDRRRLDLGQREARDELVARVLAVARGADELDDRVEVVERDEQALEHVDAALEHAQLVLRAAHDDLALVLDVVLDDLAQRQRPRHVLDERDHVHAERRLQRGVLVELVEDDLGDLVALERDDDAHPAALGGVVLEVGDAADLLLAHELGDLHDEAVVAALLHGVGQLGDDRSPRARGRCPRCAPCRARARGRGRSRRRRGCPGGRG